MDHPEYLEASFLIKQMHRLDEKDIRNVVLKLATGRL